MHDQFLEMQFRIAHGLDSARSFWTVNLKIWIEDKAITKSGVDDYGWSNDSDKNQDW